MRTHYILTFLFVLTYLTYTRCTQIEVLVSNLKMIQEVYHRNDLFLLSQSEGALKQQTG